MSKMKPFAVVFLFLWVGGLCQQSRQAIWPHFNCKKIAFYKTHKTGSTTLAGILFRVAVASNKSLYTTGNSHYVSLGFKENQQLLGRVDMVLHHIRYSDTPGFHAATRSFYGRALGTAEYGFLTVLRHPVDRYISDFYYFVEPDARKDHRRLTLPQYAAAGEGANRMALEFAVKDAAAALEFVAGEMHADGLFLPLELLDYGLALLGAHCSWELSQIMYLTTNTNRRGAERYGNVTLYARPTMAELAEEDPALFDRIAAVNSVDAILYGAAYGQLLARMQLYGTASASAVMAAAVRLTASRNQLEADCRALRAAGGVGYDGGAIPALPSQPPALYGKNISVYDLAGLCAWYSMPDSVYEKMPSPETGLVDPDAVLPSPAASWPVGRLLRLADEHLASYDNPSVPYYHSLLAVHVRPLTTAEAELVYGMADRSSGGGGGGSGDLMHTALAAAVRLWSAHHAQERLHHLVFFVDALNQDAQQEELVRQAAVAALRHRDGAAGGDGEVMSYTTFSIIPCGATTGAGGFDGGACGAAPFLDAVSRSRWSAVLPDLTHFLYGTRGSVRSVLLSYEGTLQNAGAVCAPLVPWRVPPPGTTITLPGGGGSSSWGRRDPAADSSSSNSSSSNSTDGDRRIVEQLDEEAEGGTLWEYGEAGRSGGFQRGAVARIRTERSALAYSGERKHKSGSQRMLTEVRQADAAGDGGGAVTSGMASRRRRQQQQQRLEEPSYGTKSRRRQGLAAVEGTAAATAVSGNVTANTSSTVACVRPPCSPSISKNLMARCAMIRAMPLLGHTLSYTSNGVALPEGRSSYRMPYRGPEQHRLEVARLMPPSDEDIRLAEEMAAAAAVAAATAGDSFNALDPRAFRCSRMPRPRLRLPWCEL